MTRPAHHDRDRGAGVAVVAAARRLAAAGVASPRVDAELLLAAVVGRPRAQLTLVDGLTPEQAARFEQLVARRAAREPLQHLTGRAPFRYLELAVGPGVFVPRPETELLVDAVLDRLRAAPDPVAVDLAAGSGALALALATEVPSARVIAVERSPAALEWLRRNVAEHPAAAVEVVAADLVDPGWTLALRGAVDVVVSNPPYVPAATPVGPEVAADPAEAVFAGADGLAALPLVIARAAELLAPGGVLAVEHDDTHGTAAPALLRADGRWADVRDHPDLAGRPRFATAVRR